MVLSKREDSFVSLSDEKEGSNKSCEKREFLATFSSILLLTLVAPRARSIFENIEVRSFLVAQVPLVAIAGATVASGFPHVKTKSGSSQDRPPPGWGVVPNPCNREHTQSVNSRTVEEIVEDALLSTRVASFSLQKSRLLQ